MTKGVSKRSPLKLHVVDISDNNLVELVRDLRSSVGYLKGEFLTFAVDCEEIEFSALVKSHGPDDYVLNLSALKHVLSESDPFTLMRLIRTNVFNTVSTSRVCAGEHLKKYFVFRRIRQLIL